MVVANITYKLPDAGYWYVPEGKFVYEPVEGSELIIWQPSDADSGNIIQNFKKNVLKFYGYPLGDLASAVERMEEYIEENKDYLIRLLLLYALDIEVPEEALARFHEIKKFLGSESSGAIAKYVEGEE